MIDSDPSYTQTPHRVNLNEESSDWHIKFWALAELAFPSGRAMALESNPRSFPSRELGVTVPPDEHLLCYDFLYFAVAQREREWAEDFSPAWRFVGRYAYWTPKLVGIAEGYLRRLLGVESPEDEIPPVSRFPSHI